MEHDEITSLKRGVYRIWFKDHGDRYVVASVGVDQYGDHWYAPANWPIRGVQPGVPSRSWDFVEKVQLIEAYQSTPPMPTEGGPLTGPPREKVYSVNYEAIGQGETLIAVFKDKYDAIRSFIRPILPSFGDYVWIREHIIGVFGGGQTIWETDCDTKEETRNKYERFWPEGIPDPE